MKRFFPAGEGCVQLLRLYQDLLLYKKSNQIIKYSTNFPFVVIILSTLIFPINLSAQISKVNEVYNEFRKEDFSTKYYQIGDKLPKNFVLGYNPFDSTEVYTLADFKGKAVILDMWATWCSSCIGGFPNIDSLQKIYKSKIEVFLINLQKNNPKSYGDDPEKVRNFIIQYKNNHPNFTSRFLIEKVRMHDYFLFSSIPHYVWIDRNRRIRAITDRRQITEENFTKLLSGRKMDLPVKTLRNVGYEVKK